MSTLPTNEQAREACAFMAQEIHVPAFFEKLAAHGIEPKSEAEAQQLLQLGGTLHQAEQRGQYKTAATQAQEQGNPFLDYVLEKLQSAQPSSEQVENHVKQAATTLTSDNDLARTAALVYGHVLNGGELAPVAAAAE